MEYTYWDTSDPNYSIYVRIQDNKITWMSFPEQEDCVNVGMIRQLAGEERGLDGRLIIVPREEDQN